MEALKRVAENAINLSLDRIFKKAILQPNIGEFIIELNTDNQLFKGLDATGRRLDEIGGDYHPLTVTIKESIGQPTDRVTLFFTGEFYESFFLEVFGGANGSYFEIGADFFKEGRLGVEDLRDRWGDNITGLNDDSISKLATELIGVIPEILIKELLN